MSTTRTLGAMLRERMSQDKKFNASMHAAEHSQELVKVEQFFEAAKAQFTDDIQQGRLISAIKIGNGKNTEVYSILEAYRWNDAKLCIDQNQRHPYRQVWERFTQWAQENDLRPTLKYQWDGGGIDSWHMLSVVPL